MTKALNVPTRKVVVRVFGQQWVGWHGDIVVEVDANATDEQINQMIRRNAADLPEPDNWDEADALDDIEVAEDGPHVVVGDADPDMDAVLRVFFQP